MSIIKNKPIRQHYIPKFYLKNFSFLKNGNNFVHVYDLNEKKQYISSVDNIALEKKYYDIQNSNSNKEISIEKILQVFESSAAKSINKIIKYKSLKTLSEEDRLNIAFFSSLLMTRIPRKRKMMEEVVEKMKSLAYGENNEKKERASQKLRDQIDNLDNEKLKEISIKTTLNSVIKLSPYFLNIHWTLSIAGNNDFFHTSDNPITLYNLINHSPYGSLGLAKLGINIYLPISSKITLWMYRPEDYGMIGLFDYLPALPENVIHINSELVMQATRFLYAETDSFFIEDEMRTHDKILNFSQ